MAPKPKCRPAVLKLASTGIATLCVVRTICSALVTGAAARWSPLTLVPPQRRHVGVQLHTLHQLRDPMLVSQTGTGPVATAPPTHEEQERAALAMRGAELRKAGALREAVRAKQAAAEQVSARSST